MKNSLIGTVNSAEAEPRNDRGEVNVELTIGIASDVHYGIKIIDELMSRALSGGYAYICLEKPRKPKRHKKAKISGSKVVKAITDDIAAGGEYARELIARHSSALKAADICNAHAAIADVLTGAKAGDMERVQHSKTIAPTATFVLGADEVHRAREFFKVCLDAQAESEGRIINMAIESGLATLCTGTGAVFPAMRDDVDIRAEVLEFARQVKALAVSEACFNEMLERHRNDTATPDAEVQEPKPSREALIDQFNKTHWVDNVGQGVSWRERELMKKVWLVAHGYKD